MNYRHVYMLIIEHAKSEMKNGLRPKSSYYRKNFPGQYFEFHHILPRSLYPLWVKRKSNLVALTAREHFFCHQLLDKIYPNSNMFLAIWLLANDGKDRYCIKSSHAYEKLKKRFSEYISNKFKGHSFNKGRYEKFSDDKKLEIKEKQKKTRLLNGTNPIGEKNGMFGKHWSEHPEWKRYDRTGEHNPNYGNHELRGENSPMYGTKRCLRECMTEEAYKQMLENQRLSNTPEYRKKISDSLKAYYKEHPYTETPEQKEQRIKKAVETRRKNGSYKHSIEQDAKTGKAVRCIEDDLVFISMNRCEKYYGIRRLMRYIQENNGLHPKINKHFELILP